MTYALKSSNVPFQILNLVYDMSDRKTIAPMVEEYSHANLIYIGLTYVPSSETNTSKSEYFRSAVSTRDLRLNGRELCHDLVSTITSCAVCFHNILMYAHHLFFLLSGFDHISQKFNNNTLDAWRTYCECGGEKEFVQDYAENGEKLFVPTDDNTNHMNATEIRDANDAIKRRDAAKVILNSFYRIIVPKLSSAGLNNTTKRSKASKKKSLHSLLQSFFQV